MIYLASPYSDSNPDTQQWRFERTRAKTAELIKEGAPVFSPIVHCHYMALKYDMPSDQEFWWQYNRKMLSKADEVWVYMLEGWEKSAGVSREIQYAEVSGIPVEYII